MKKYDWSEFTKRIAVKAPPKSIYDAWTTQQGLESWFLRLAEFRRKDGTVRAKNDHIQAGDSYKWLWHGYDDSVVENNEVKSANGWDELSFSFSGRCLVTVSIKQEKGETICSVKQQMPMDSEEEQRYYYIECGQGWTFYLANLKSMFEGGTDLRNKNAELQELINA